MFTSVFAALEQSCLSQNRDPVAFFQMLEKQGFWQLLWPTRFIVLIGGLFLLPFTLVVLTGERLVILATVVAACTFLMVSGAFMIIASPIAGSQPFLWISYIFLYHFSCPFLVVVIFCSLAPLTSIGLWLGWYSGLPWLLGISLADACTLSVYQSARQTRSQLAYQRKGGPTAELPELELWQWMNAVRIGVVALLVGGAGVIAWLYIGAGNSAMVMMICGAAGCARLEAMLLMNLGWPLVHHDVIQDYWHGTYVGRNMLFTKSCSIMQAIVSAPSPFAASAIIMTLLREGCPSAVVRRVCSKLPASQMQQILLYLSLAEGGGEIIGYLESCLPSYLLQRRAQCYAKLATEAAKPLDLQRWVALLPEYPTPDGVGTLDNIDQMLVNARKALLEYRNHRVVESPIRDISQQITELCNKETRISAKDVLVDYQYTWPLALKIHLEQHYQQLYVPRLEINSQAVLD